MPGLVVGTALALLAAVPAGAAEGAPGAAKTALAGDTVKAFDALFAGPHAGARAVHAKGILVEGSFVPAPEAAGISLAPHFQGETRVFVRFSNFPGLPGNADGDPTSGPRGMAVKFLLGDGGETDIVAHSYNGFPAATPEKFLEFLRIVGTNDAAQIDALAAHEPAVRRFLATDKPAPESYGTQAFFGVNAFRFTNASGQSRHGRYRIEPVAGEHYLGSAEARARAPDYLGTDLAQRLAAGPVRFRLVLQLAASADDVADGSRPWPNERETITLGTIGLSALAENQGAQRAMLFTPLSLVPGIAASADPLLAARTRTYRISHERRAGETSADASGAEESRR